MYNHVHDSVMCMCLPGAGPAQHAVHYALLPAVLPCSHEIFPRPLCGSEGGLEAEQVRAPP